MSFSDNLNEVFDVPGIETQGKGAKGVLIDFKQTVIETDKEVKNLNESLTKVINLKGLNINLKQADDAASKMALTTQRLAKAKLDEAKADTEKARASKVAAEETIKSSKEQERLDKILQKKNATLAKENNEYEKLKKTYRDLSNEAKRLGIELGVDDAKFKAAAASAHAMHTQLLGVEMAVGQAQRQVGNYNMVGAQFNQLLREAPNFAISFRTGIMALSNNLTYFIESITESIKKGGTLKSVFKEVASSAFGIVGIINIAVTAFTMLTMAMAKTEKATKGATDALDEHRKALTGIIQSAREEIDVETRTAAILNSIATDRRLTDEQRLKAVKELRDAYPGYLKGYSDEKIMAGEAQAAIDKINKAIENKAAAQAAANYAAKQNTQLIDNENGLYKRQQDALNAVADAEKALAKARKNATGSEASQLAIQDANTALDKTKDTYKAIGLAIDGTKRAQQEATREAEKYAKAAGDLFFSDKTNKEPKAKVPTDLTNEELDVAKRIIEAKAKISRLELEYEKSLNGEIIANDQLNYEERLQAINDLYVNRSRLLEIDQQKELDVIQSQLTKIGEIEKKAAKDRTVQEKKLLIQKEAFLIEELAVIVDYEIKQQEILSGFSTSTTDVLKKGTDEEVAYRIDALDKIARYTNEGYTKDLLALADSLKSGNKNIQQYRNERKLLENKYAKETLSAQIEYLNEEVNSFEGSSEQKEALLQKLHDLRIALADETIKDDEERKKKEDAEHKAKMERLQLWVDGVKKAMDIINNLQNKRTERVLDGLDREQEEVQNTEERDRARAERTIADDKEREEAILKIEADAEGKRIDIDKRRADAQKAQAKREKEIALISVIANLIVGISKEIASKGVAGLATSAAIGLYTAALTGTIAALSIPAYAEGTDNHPGGPAIVGEGKKGSGYRKELVKTGNKTFMVDKPTYLPNLAKGAKVIPMPDSVNFGAISPQALNSVMLAGGGNSERTEALLSEVLNELKHGNALPRESTSLEDGFTHRSVQKGNDRYNYLRKSIYE